MTVSSFGYLDVFLSKHSDIEPIKNLDIAVVYRKIVYEYVQMWPVRQFQTSSDLDV
jgi:hypothetical protein